jgi:hypothetical protein
MEPFKFKQAQEGLEEQKDLSAQLATFGDNMIKNKMSGKHDVLNWSPSKPKPKRSPVIPQPVGQPKAEQVQGVQQQEPGIAQVNEGVQGEGAPQAEQGGQFYDEEDLNEYDEDGHFIGRQQPLARNRREADEERRKFLEARFLEAKGPVFDRMAAEIANRQQQEPVAQEDPIEEVNRRWREVDAHPVVPQAVGQPEAEQVQGVQQQEPVEQENPIEEVNRRWREGAEERQAAAQRAEELVRAQEAEREEKRKAINRIGNLIRRERRARERAREEENARRRAREEQEDPVGSFIRRSSEERRNRRVKEEENARQREAERELRELRKLSDEEWG